MGTDTGVCTHLQKPVSSLKCEQSRAQQAHLLGMTAWASFLASTFSILEGVPYLPPPSRGKITVRALTLVPSLRWTPEVRGVDRFAMSDGKAGVPVQHNFPTRHDTLSKSVSSPSPFLQSAPCAGCSARLFVTQTFWRLLSSPLPSKCEG